MPYDFNSFLGGLNQQMNSGGLNATQAMAQLAQQARSGAGQMQSQANQGWNQMSGGQPLFNMPGGGTTTSAMQNFDPNMNDQQYAQYYQRWGGRDQYGHTLDNPYDRMSNRARQGAPPAGLLQQNNPLPQFGLGVGQGVPGGNAIAMLERAGMPIPDYLRNVAGGRPIGLGDLNTASLKLGGSYLPTPQAFSRMNPSEQSFLQGFMETMLGIPMGDIQQAAGQPFAGLRSARAAR